MRSHFDEQLDSLNREMTAMGGLCENAIESASASLVQGDILTLKNVFKMSESITRMERDIENMCLKLLLQQQPVAKDLRIISSALKMVTDMKRIGDQAADIAEIITTANVSVAKDTMGISIMAKATMKMVKESIDAFVNKDTELAKSVIKYDDVVDAHFDRIKKILSDDFTYNKNNGECVMDLLLITKYFERIGDHAVNIANWVLFSITGDREEE